MSTVPNETKQACADMILASAIEDMAAEEGISVAAARDALVMSPAYACLYNFDSELWKEGPDYFRFFYEQCRQDAARRA